MDRLIYTAMTGASSSFKQQAGVANNIANASTIGFRSMVHQFRAAPIQGDGSPTRAFVADASVANNFEQGPMMQTGRPLDVAIQGKGWIAVEDAQGNEVFTRAGNFQISTNGILQTPAGFNILGDGGPIAIPPDNSVSIGADGTISAIPLFGTPNNVAVVGRIKLVNPPEETLIRRDDGFFEVAGNIPQPMDENMKLATETLEGSNINPADAMINLISVARQFETQIKLLQMADANANKATQILSLS